MKRWAMIIGGALALSAAGPAAAQDAPAEPPVAQEIAAAGEELVDKLEALGEALGLDAPIFPPGLLNTALTEALPILPDDEPNLSWSSGFAFDFTTDRSTGDLEADPEGRVVLTDARGCVGADEVAEVVHFQRFSRDGVRGHRCVTAFRGASGEDIWVLQSRTFAEGPNRRFSAFYAVATAVAGDEARARQALEARLDQNVALAGVLADYAFEMFLLKEVSSDPTTLDNFAERAARLQARLGEIAE